MKREKSCKTAFWKVFQLLKDQFQLSLALMPDVVIAAADNPNHGRLVQIQIY